MNAPVAPLITAEALVRTAWNDTDYLGDLLPHSIHYRRHIAGAIDDAADILCEQGAPEPTEDVIKRARLLLEMQTDEWLEQQEKQRRNVLADAADAGDCDWGGNVLAYPKYRGV